MLSGPCSLLYQHYTLTLQGLARVISLCLKYFSWRKAILSTRYGCFAAAAMAERELNILEGIN